MRAGEDSREKAAAIIAANRILQGKARGLAGLKAARTAAGLTQLEAAERVGVSKATWGQWEQQRFWPSAFYLPAIATALNVTIAQLYLPPEV